MRQWSRLWILAIWAALLPACSPPEPAASRNDRVLFLLGEEYDPQEFWGPYAVLSAAGYRVDLAGAKKGMDLTPDSDIPEANIRTNISLDEVKVSDYFALIVPGGPSAANVARFPKAGQIAREFNAAGKPIGTVCHGARLLMPEGIFKNRPTTCVFMVADEICDQWKARDYGLYLDLPVVIDKNLITSRDPRDVPAMGGALVDRFAQAGGLKVPRRDARVLIALAGATPHQTWVLDQLSIFGISPTVWSGGAAPDSEPGAGRAPPDMLVIVDRAGSAQLNSSTSLASVADSFKKSGKRVIEAGDILQAMRQIVEHASLARSSPKTAAPDSDQWVAKYAAAIAKPLKGAAWNPGVEYEGVLALWNGYDDDAAARMSEFLAREGRRILMVGTERGPLAGLNGGTAEVAATYDDPIRLSRSAVIIAPGGVWPKKTKAQQAVQPQWVEDNEPARQRRLDWLIAQYKSGRTLVAFGFDSLHIGQRPLFKGRQFASTDQASVIWFGSDGAEYSPAKALFSDKNLLTAKPLVGVDEAIALLAQLARRR
jgi:protease I